jgi:hypothetical protein
MFDFMTGRYKKISKEYVLFLNSAFIGFFNIEKLKLKIMDFSVYPLQRCTVHCTYACKQYIIHICEERTDRSILLLGGGGGRVRMKEQILGGQGFSSSLIFYDALSRLLLCSAFQVIRDPTNASPTQTDQIYVYIKALRHVC